MSKNEQLELEMAAATMKQVLEVNKRLIVENERLKLENKRLRGTLLILDERGGVYSTPAVAVRLEGVPGMFRGEN